MKQTMFKNVFPKNKLNVFRVIKKNISKKPPYIHIYI